MQTTPWLKLTYPDPGDHTRTWEYWAALATQLETRFGPIGLLHRNTAWQPTGTGWRNVDWNSEPLGGQHGFTYDAAAETLACQIAGMYEMEALAVMSVRTGTSQVGRLGIVSDGPSMMSSFTTVTPTNLSRSVSAFVKATGRLEVGNKVWTQLEQITDATLQIDYAYMKVVRI